MAWTTPRTWLAPLKVTAAILNTEVRDLLNHLGATHNHDGNPGSGSPTLSSLVSASFADAAAPSAPGAGLTRLFSTAGLLRMRAGASGASRPFLLGGTAHRLPYLDATGEQAELAYGAADTFLRSGGAGVAPNWSTITLPFKRRTATQTISGGGSAVDNTISFTGVVAGDAYFVELMVLWNGGDLDISFSNASPYLLAYSCSDGQSGFRNTAVLPTFVGAAGRIAHVSGLLVAAGSGTISPSYATPPAGGVDILALTYAVLTKQNP